MRHSCVWIAVASSIALLLLASHRLRGPFREGVGGEDDVLRAGGTCMERLSALGLSLLGEVRPLLHTDLMTKLPGSVMRIYHIHSSPPGRGRWGLIHQTYPHWPHPSLHADGPTLKRDQIYSKMDGNIRQRGLSLGGVITQGLKQVRGWLCGQYKRE